MPGDFVVIDGRVDAGTYAGWKLYHTACYVCHGVGGTGTDVAPNLVERIGNYTPRGFATKVLSSYRIVPMPDGTAADREAEREALLELLMKRERQSQGQPLMPAWDVDDEVVPHVLDLYAYLNARAAGVLGPGKPKRAARAAALSGPQRRISSARSMPPDMIEISAFSRTADLGW